MTNLGFGIYLLFVTSWFLHLGYRVPVLGLIRIDMILVAVLAVLAFLGTPRRQEPMTDTDKWLRVLIIYCVLSIPFVEWPGSVIRFGLEALIKGVVFYYFTVAFVDSEARLKTFITVFVGCQLFRVMEPLYLNVTEGYWGAGASMANWERLERLSGAPSDIVNPNGLAFIICTVLPFLWFMARLSWFNSLVFLVSVPLSVYALMLTGSRTGVVGLIIVVIGFLAKAKRRLVLAAACVLVALLGFPLLSNDMQDRYLSLIGAGPKNVATAEGRVTGVITHLEVALRRPFFGHGLGTSQEASANFADIDQVAHNLIAEVALELGFVGLVIFAFLIISIFTAFRRCKKAYADREAGTFLARTVDAMQVWLLLNIVFSLASYGLTSYEWYLLGGLAVVLQRLAVHAPSASRIDAPVPAAGLTVPRTTGVLAEPPQRRMP
jgi:O-antigen ligase